MFGSGTAAVVLAHMGNAVSTEADWYPLARRLARERYLVLTYNRRAVCSGEKADYDCSAGANDWGKAWQDVVGAVKFVESRGARRVAVGGSSIGGTSVIYAAATGRIRPVALISLAGVNHINAYSLTPAGVRRIGGAKLFVSGRRDLDGAAASAREFNRWARPPKRMVLLDTDYHGTDMLRHHRSGIGGQLTKLIVRFLRASMPPRREGPGVRLDMRGCAAWRARSRSSIAAAHQLLGRGRPEVPRPGVARRRRACLQGARARLAAARSGRPVRASGDRRGDRLWRTGSS